MAAVVSQKPATKPWTITPREASSNGLSSVSSIASTFAFKKVKKIENSQDLVDHGFPDIEWEVIFSGTNKYHSAVECKWRERFRDSKIERTTEDQIEMNINYQQSRRITVFVVFGVGGQPGSP